MTKYIELQEYLKQNQNEAQNDPANKNKHQPNHQNEGDWEQSDDPKMRTNT